MISTADVRAALITLLKANALLAALVGDDIREESWMGRAYTYPNVRVYITRLESSRVSRNCATYYCDFLISYRSADTSSRACSDGMKIAHEAVVGLPLTSPVFVSMTPAVFDSVTDPVPESEDAWMSRAFFSCRLKEL